MKNITEALALSIENPRTSKLLTLLIAAFFLTLYAMPADCQFADLPQDAKTVDIGVNGDGASQTFSLTAVIPFRRLNGWAGVFWFASTFECCYSRFFTATIFACQPSMRITHNR